MARHTREPGRAAPARRSRRSGRPLAGSYPTDTATAELVADGDAAAGWTLLLDGIPSSHLDLADPTRLEFEYVRWCGDLLDALAPPRTPLETVHLGGGAMTLARYVEATRPGSGQVVVEVDERLLRLVRAQFGLPGGRRLQVRVADARAGLARLPGASCDVVVRDAFVGTWVPAHLATVEFTREVARALRPGGAYLLNVADQVPFPVAGGEAANLLAVFPHALLVSDPSVLRGRRHGNLVLAASTAPLPVEALARSVARGPVAGRVRGTDGVRALAAGRRPVTDADPPVVRPAPPTWGLD